MVVDNTTKPSALSIQIEDSIASLEEMRKKAEEDCQNEDAEERGYKLMTLSEEHNSLNPSEYYFDDTNNEIHFNGEFGKGFYYISIPLSDEVLIDILQHAIKKMNKLKLAMESLK